MQAEKPQKCTSVRSDFTEISVSVVISTQFEFGAAIRGALFSVSLEYFLNFWLSGHMPWYLP